jgi:molybdenum cofactor guanylyltransferase
MYCGVPEEDPDKLVALILSGGKSQRMGVDKGGMLLNGKRWVEHAADLCVSVGLPVFYSIQPEQMDEYAQFLNSEALIIDSVGVKGPLAGLLTFYILHPNTDVLLLPCDMIKLSSDILKGLVETFETISIGHDIIVYQHPDGTIEPMPGIYTSDALRKLYWLYASGGLMKHSLKHCIEISNTFLLPIEFSQLAFFKNANTPEDIA